MKFFSHVQSGLMLVELLIVVAIAAMLAAPLGAMVLNALDARSVAGDTNDVAQQAQFAMQRMEAAVRRTAPPLAAVAADMLSPVAYCLRASDKSLRETKPADITSCSSDTAPVIADGVTAFGLQPFSAVVGVAPVIVIQLTVTGATGQSISLTSRTRLGGGTL
jgi:Tfp pilus assembly protein FimT